MSSLTHHSEFQLVKSLKNGSVLAFNTLFHHYSNRLYQFSLKYLKSEEEAEELVQEVFTRVWEKRSELKAELSFNSYLFTIAFNVIRKYFRRKTHLIDYLNSKVKDDLNLDTVKKVDYDSLKKHLDNLVSLLPHRRKEIFVKSRYEGFTTREIADDMKISKKTVENQLTEALRFIRTHLSREHLAGIIFFCLFVS
ncbi:MAG TPA: RNA polymerase sigma-70 factor [Bacteroidales bacterium]|nr:RNA polymerase sigma-70 factor [Bacteroidales bacterium]